jgi:hypothetical protein
MVSLLLIKDNGCSIYKDKLYYRSSFMMNDLYMLKIDKSVLTSTNDSKYLMKV